MLLYTFECSACHIDRRHITPALALLVSYKDHCIHCTEIQTFNFVREEKMTVDWFTDVEIPNVMKKDADLLYKSKKKDGKIVRIAS